MPHVSISAETLFHVGSFAVSNSLLLAVFTTVVLFAVGLTLTLRLATVPGRIQGIAELFIEGALGLMDSVLGDRSASRKYLPLVATIFLFVLVSNWLGLLPVVGTVGITHEGVEHGFVPLLRAPGADLNFTIALAAVSVLAVNVLGAIAIGLRSHLKKFFSFKNPIYTFVGFLEFVSEFVKMISFSFRLFGNIFAGEVLLTIVAFLVPYAAPVPFLFLEIFVGFIQALIFSMLTLVFLGMAIMPHEVSSSSH